MTLPVLTRAKLSGAQLRDAILHRADLSTPITSTDDADLTDAHLTSGVGENRRTANLTNAILDNAKWPDDATVPDGWRKDEGSGRLTRVQ